ncbi:TIGR03089 family protein [Micromonospora zhanjiangensis]|uniref:TIGR03089 family protein n=1 Tax=Micromonospora zhanjiangensis TaxID=1522057 RepID=A0ABV8KRG5_9ACTN
MLSASPGPGAVLADPAHGGHPLLTYLDAATGERAELSAAQLGGWAARTAHLLLDECRLTVGDRVAVLLPPHWQTAAVLFGAWSAGLSVAFHPAATAGLPRIGPGANGPFQVTFAALRRIDDWLEDVPPAEHRFALGLTPDAAPLAEVPDGYRDYVAAVRRHADTAPPYDAVRGGDAATVDGTTFAQWRRLAEEIAARHGFRAGDRVLVDTAHEHPVTWLLAPLVTGASIVLCANADADADALARHARREGATRVLSTTRP